MDTTSALNEWYKICQYVASNGEKSGRHRRPLRSYIDTDCLIDRVERLTKVYGTGEYLHEKDSSGTRTRYVFVAAPQEVSGGYSLFRSYPRLGQTLSPKIPELLREGPKSHFDFRMSEAFAVTSATKYFTPPYIVDTPGRDRMQFHDTTFPNPHPITELALNEMWSLYGYDVPIASVVNLGPSRVDEVSRKHVTQSSKSLSRINPPPTPSEQRITRTRGQGAGTGESGTKSDEELALEKMGDILEIRIRRRLEEVYPQETPSYHRFALNQCVPGAALDDSRKAKETLELTKKYLRQQDVKAKMEEVAKRLSLKENRL